jgi:hypothetical protein
MTKEEQKQKKQQGESNKKEIKFNTQIRLKDKLLFKEIEELISL